VTTVFDLDLITVVQHRADVVSPRRGLGQGCQGIQSRQRSGCRLQFIRFVPHGGTDLLEKPGFDLNYLFFGTEDLFLPLF
jgi:hypothetical protein